MTGTPGSERALAESFEHGRSPGVIVRIEVLDTEPNPGIEEGFASVPVPGIEMQDRIADPSDLTAAVAASDERGDLLAGFELGSTRPERPTFEEGVQAAHTRATSLASRSEVYSSPKPVAAATMKTKKSSHPWKTNGQTCAGLTIIAWVNHSYSPGSVNIAA